MKIVIISIFVMLTGCGLRSGVDSEPSKIAHSRTAYQEASKNPIESFNSFSSRVRQIVQPEKNQLEIEVKYLGFPNEEPHVATYRLKGGWLEFELHKVDRPPRRWSVSSDQLESLKSVIDSVDDQAWSGIYWEPVFDGGMILCAIREGDFESEFQGLNAFPPCFAELMNAMDAIAGEQVGAFWEMPSGLHFESMEAMGEVGSEEIQRMLDEREKERSIQLDNEAEADEEANPPPPRS